jgi:hypothetical protein
MSLLQPQITPAHYAADGCFFTPAAPFSPVFADASFRRRFSIRFAAPLVTFRRHFRRWLSGC